MDPSDDVTLSELILDGLALANLLEDLPSFEAVQEIEEHVMHLDMAGRLSKILFMKLYDAAEEAVTDLEPARQTEILEGIVKFADPSWFGFDFSVPPDDAARPGKSLG